MAQVQAGVQQQEVLATTPLSGNIKGEVACGCGSSSEEAGNDPVATDGRRQLLAIEFLEVAMPSTNGEGCSACDSVRGRLDSAIEAVRPLFARLGTEVEVEAARVRTEAEARTLGLHASPTIRIGNVVVAPEHRGTGEERLWQWRGDRFAAPPQGMLVDMLIRGYAATVTSASADVGDQEKDARGDLPAYLLQFLTAGEAGKSDRVTALADAQGVPSGSEPSGR